MILGICNNCRKEFRKRENKYKFCSLVCSSNFNKNGLKQIKLPSYNKYLAEFIGICLGDGWTSTYQVGIKLNSIADKDYVLVVTKLAKSLFPEVNISIYKTQKENSVNIRINSRVVSDFMKKMGIISYKKSVPAWINSSISYKKACVRGLIDTERSISIKRYKNKNIYYQLNFRNYDKKIMKFVRGTLLELGMRPTMSLKKSLYLSNSESISTYRKEIGFSNPKFFLKLKKIKNIMSSR